MASTSDGAARARLDPAAFKGRVSIVNVWASWCVPCHDEAPLLTELGKDTRLQVVGINYKDAPENARRFLGRYGNPFGMVGVDGNGRAAIEWGVYGVPETFIVGRDGTDRLQAGRPDHARQSRHRAEGGDRQGAEGGDVVAHSLRMIRTTTTPISMIRGFARARLATLRNDARWVV